MYDISSFTASATKSHRGNIKIKNYIYTTITILKSTTRLLKIQKNLEIEGKENRTITILKKINKSIKHSRKRYIKIRIGSNVIRCDEISNRRPLE